MAAAQAQLAAAETEARGQAVRIDTLMRQVDEAQGRWERWLAVAIAVVEWVAVQQFEQNKFNMYFIFSLCIFFFF